MSDQLSLFAFRSRSYHARTPVQAHDAARFDAKARAQEDTIRAWFEAHPGRWTASEVHLEAACEWVIDSKSDYRLERWPLTSTRRAMTNLTNCEPPVLRMTLDRRPGPYGRPEHAYELTNQGETNG